MVDAVAGLTAVDGATLITSHYELLRAFADDETLWRASAALDAGGYRTHEFGDSVLIRRGATHQVSRKLLEVMQLPI